MGLSDYPSNSRKLLEGIAVGLFVRYRCEGSAESPCECIIHTRGCYGEPLVNICYPFIHFMSSFHFDRMAKLHLSEDLSDVGSRIKP